MQKNSQPLRWSLDILKSSEGIRSKNSPLTDAAKGTHYPFRALRYWHGGQLIADEWTRRGSGTEPFTVLDLGCKRGTQKMLTPPLSNTRWIGLDLKMKEETVRELGYDETHLATFDEPFPLPDNAADMAVCLHVFEHLPRVDFTLGEIARVLRPNGVLVVGTPILPLPIAKIRDSQFKREFAQGKRRPGNHIHAFDPGRWKRTLESNGYRVEKIFGSHLYRQSGNPLENREWWVRLNQAWGLAFPSLGRDIIVQARVTK